MRPRACNFVLLSLFVAASIFAQTPDYTYRADHDLDGIGKFYAGREIAHVMGHEAADWLERPGRQQEERTDLLLQLLPLHPGDVAADIGAGSGYMSWRMAEKVGDRGRVYCVDIQQEMLDLLAKNMNARHTTNYQSILGSITDARLPANSTDLVLMVDVYHEFDHPYEMMQSITRGLKPGGRIAWVEYRKEDPNVPIKKLHEMTEAQARKEAALLPELEWVETIEKLPRQHIFILRKKGG
ncbi:MAG TPA: class I SAM-dependent methyltransferase [Verrucomicrobiae bacterium]|jgi:ubiquinone/menaquinone biosynthesis C-methylase UbiE